MTDASWYSPLTVGEAGLLLRFPLLRFPTLPGDVPPYTGGGMTYDQVADMILRDRDPVNAALAIFSGQYYPFQMPEMVTDVANEVLSELELREFQGDPSLRPVLGQFFQVCLAEAKKLDPEHQEEARALHIVARQGLNLLSWSERGIPATGATRLTTDPDEMLQSPDKERGPSFLDAHTMPTFQAEGEGLFGDYWRGAELVGKMGGNISIDAMYSQDTFEAQKDNLVLYVMDHGWMEVPPDLRDMTERGEISTIHQTSFATDLLPGSVQFASTGPGHYQGEKSDEKSVGTMDFKYVTKGRAIQHNKFYDDEGNLIVDIVQNLDAETNPVGVALPGAVDSIENLGDCEFTDFSTDVPEEEAREFLRSINPRLDFDAIQEKDAQGRIKASAATVPYFAAFIDGEAKLVQNTPEAAPVRWIERLNIGEGTLESIYQGLNEEGVAILRREVLAQVSSGWCMLEDDQAPPITTVESIDPNYIEAVGVLGEKLKNGEPVESKIYFADGKKGYTWGDPIPQSRVLGRMGAKTPEDRIALAREYGIKEEECTEDEFVIGERWVGAGPIDVGTGYDLAPDTLYIFAEEAYGYEHATTIGRESGLTAKHLTSSRPLSLQYHRFPEAIYPLSRGYAFVGVSQGMNAEEFIQAMRSGVDIKTLFHTETLRQGMTVPPLVIHGYGVVEVYETKAVNSAQDKTGTVSFCDRAKLSDDDLAVVEAIVQENGPEEAAEILSNPDHPKNTLNRQLVRPNKDFLTMRTADGQIDEGKINAIAHELRNAGSLEEVDVSDLIFSAYPVAEEYLGQPTTCEFVSETAEFITLRYTIQPGEIIPCEERMNAEKPHHTLFVSEGRVEVLDEEGNVYSTIDGSVDGRIHHTEFVETLGRYTLRAVGDEPAVVFTQYRPVRETERAEEGLEHIVEPEPDADIGLGPPQVFYSGMPYVPGLGKWLILALGLDVARRNIPFGQIFENPVVQAISIGALVTLVLIGIAALVIYLVARKRTGIVGHRVATIPTSAAHGVLETGPAKPVREVPVRRELTVAAKRPSLSRAERVGRDRIFANLLMAQKIVNRARQEGRLLDAEPLEEGDQEPEYLFVTRSFSEGIGFDDPALNALACSVATQTINLYLDEYHRHVATDTSRALDIQLQLEGRILHGFRPDSVIEGLLDAAIERPEAMHPELIHAIMRWLSIPARNIQVGIKTYAVLGLARVYGISLWQNEYQERDLLDRILSRAYREIMIPRDSIPELAQAEIAFAIGVIWRGHEVRLLKILEQFKEEKPPRLAEWFGWADSREQLAEGTLDEIIALARGALEGQSSLKMVTTEARALLEEQGPAETAVKAALDTPLLTMAESPLPTTIEEDTHAINLVEVPEGSSTMEILGPSRLDRDSVTLARNVEVNFGRLSSPDLMQQYRGDVLVAVGKVVDGQLCVGNNVPVNEVINMLQRERGIDRVFLVVCNNGNGEIGQVDAEVISATGDVFATPVLSPLTVFADGDWMQVKKQAFYGGMPYVPGLGKWLFGAMALDVAREVARDKFSISPMWIGIGLVGLALVIMAAIFIWRRIARARAMRRSKIRKTGTDDYHDNFVRWLKAGLETGEIEPDAPLVICDTHIDIGDQSEAFDHGSWIRAIRQMRLRVGRIYIVIPEGSTVDIWHLTAASGIDAEIVVGLHRLPRLEGPVTVSWENDFIYWSSENQVRQDIERSARAFAELDIDIQALHVTRMGEPDEHPGFMERTLHNSLRREGYEIGRTTTVLGVMFGRVVRWIRTPRGIIITIAILLPVLYLLFGWLGVVFGVISMVASGGFPGMPPDGDMSGKPDKPESERPEQVVPAGATMQLRLAGEKYGLPANLHVLRHSLVRDLGSTREGRTMPINYDDFVIRLLLQILHSPISWVLFTRNPDGSIGDRRYLHYLANVIYEGLVGTLEDSERPYLPDEGVHRSSQADPQNHPIVPEILVVCEDRSRVTSLATTPPGERDIDISELLLMNFTPQGQQPKMLAVLMQLEGNLQPDGTFDNQGLLNEAVAQIETGLTERLGGTMVPMQPVLSENDLSRPLLLEGKVVELASLPVRPQLINLLFTSRMHEGKPSDYEPFVDQFLMQCIDYGINVRDTNYLGRLAQNLFESVQACLAEPERAHASLPYPSVMARRNEVVIANEHRHGMNEDEIIHRTISTDHGISIVTHYVFRFRFEGHSQTVIASVMSFDVPPRLDVMPAVSDVRSELQRALTQTSILRYSIIGAIWDSVRSEIAEELQKTRNLSDDAMRDAVERLRTRFARLTASPQRESYVLELRAGEDKKLAEVFNRKKGDIAQKIRRAFQLAGRQIPVTVGVTPEGVVVRVTFGSRSLSATCLGLGTGDFEVAPDGKITRHSRRRKKDKIRERADTFLAGMERDSVEYAALYTKIYGYRSALRQGLHSLASIDTDEFVAVSAPGEDPVLCMRRRDFPGLLDIVAGPERKVRKLYVYDRDGKEFVLFPLLRFREMVKALLRGDWKECRAAFRDCTGGIKRKNLQILPVESYPARRVNTSSYSEILGVAHATPYFAHYLAQYAAQKGARRIACTARATEPAFEVLSMQSLIDRRATSAHMTFISEDVQGEMTRRTIHRAIIRTVQDHEWDDPPNTFERLKEAMMGEGGFFHRRYMEEHEIRDPASGRIVGRYRDRETVAVDTSSGNLRKTIRVYSEDGRSQIGTVTAIVKHSLLIGQTKEVLSFEVNAGLRQRLQEEGVVVENLDIQGLDDFPWAEIINGTYNQIKEAGLLDGMAAGETLCIGDEFGVGSWPMFGAFAIQHLSALEGTPINVVYFQGKDSLDAGELDGASLPEGFPQMSFQQIREDFFAEREKSLKDELRKQGVPEERINMEALRIVQGEIFEIIRYATDVASFQAQPIMITDGRSARQTGTPILRTDVPISPEAPWESIVAYVASLEYLDGLVAFRERHGHQLPALRERYHAPEAPAAEEPLTPERRLREALNALTLDELHQIWRLPFHLRLRTLMSERFIGVTRVELARMARVSPRTVSLWITRRGEQRRYPNPENLTRLQHIFGGVLLRGLDIQTGQPLIRDEDQTLVTPRAREAAIRWFGKIIGSNRFFLGLLFAPIYESLRPYYRGTKFVDEDHGEEQTPEERAQRMFGLGTIFGGMIMAPLALAVYYTVIALTGGFADLTVLGGIGVAISLPLASLAGNILMHSAYNAWALWKGWAMLTTDEKTVDQLREAISDTTASVRYAAIRSLRELATSGVEEEAREAVDALKRTFGHWDVQTELHALEALNDIGSVEGLISGLQYLSHSEVSDTASNYLAAIGTDVIPQLERLFTFYDGDMLRDIRMRNTILETLGKIVDDSAIPPIAETLHDSEHSVRSMVKRLLAIRGETAIPYVINELERPIGHERRACNDAVDIFTRMGESAVPAFAQVLTHRMKHIRRVAMRALIKIGTEPARSALRVALKDPDPYNRKVAVDALLGEELEAQPLQIDQDPSIVLGLLGASEDAVKRANNNRTRGRVHFIALPRSNTEEENLKLIEAEVDRVDAYAGGVTQDINDIEDLDQEVDALIDLIEEHDKDHFTTHPEEVALNKPTVERIRRVLLAIEERSPIIRSLRARHLSVYRMKFREADNEVRLQSQDETLLDSIEENTQGPDSKYVPIIITHFAHIGSVAREHRKIKAEYEAKHGQGTYPFKPVLILSHELVTNYNLTGRHIESILEEEHVTDVFTEDQVFLERTTGDTENEYINLGEGSDMIYQITQALSLRYLTTITGRNLAIGAIGRDVNVSNLEELDQMLLQQAIFVSMNEEDGLASQLYSIIVQIVANSNNAIQPEAMPANGGELTPLGSNCFTFRPIVPANMDQLKQEIENYDDVFMAV